MATIGKFTQSKDGGWTGTIRTLTINAKVRLVPNDNREKASAPAYRLMLEQCCIGAAWETRGTKDPSRLNLRVRIDDPMFYRSLYATLMAGNDGQTAILTWTASGYSPGS